MQKLATKYVLAGELAKDYDKLSIEEKIKFGETLLTDADKKTLAANEVSATPTLEPTVAPTPSAQPTVSETHTSESSNTSTALTESSDDKKVDAEPKKVDAESSGTTSTSTAPTPSVTPVPTHVTESSSATSETSVAPTVPSVGPTVPSEKPTVKDPTVTVEPITIEQGTSKIVPYTVTGKLSDESLSVLTFDGHIDIIYEPYSTIDRGNSTIRISTTDDVRVTPEGSPLVYKIMNGERQVGTLTVTVVAKTAVESAHTESDATHNEGSKPHVTEINYVEDEVKNSFQIKQGETKVFHYVPVFSDGKEHDASDTTVDQTFAANEDYVTHFKELGITITPDFVNRTITISASDTASVENGHSYYFGEANGTLSFGVVSKE